MSDPWLIQGEEKKREINNETEATELNLSFEDNFANNSSTSLINSQSSSATNQNKVVKNTPSDISSSITPHQALPDSESYLKGLERKLQKIKKNSKLVDALAEKREDCLRSLIDEGFDTIRNNNNDALIQLDTAINNGDSAVHEIYRHLQPIQPITIGETVHIVKHDQLAEQVEEEHTEAADSDTIKN